MQLDGSGIISASRFNFGHKATKVDSLQVKTDIAHPFLCVPMPTHALEASGISFGYFDVAGVLFVAALAKIFLPVVKAITRSVVYLFFWMATKNGAMHRDIATILSSRCIETSSTFFCIPIKFGQPFKIIKIHDGGFTLRKCNESVRLIKRLGNAMPLLRLSGHLSSLKDFWCSTAILPQVTHARA